MKEAARFAVIAAAALALTALSTRAQDCRLQIRCSGFTPAKYYTVLLISFAASTNACAGVRVAVDWSDDLRTWNPVAQVSLPCLTQGATVQVIDETDSRTRPRRFYHARAAGACP